MILLLCQILVRLKKDHGKSAQSDDLPSDLIISAASLRWSDLYGAPLFVDVPKEYVMAGKQQISSVYEAYNFQLIFLFHFTWHAIQIWSLSESTPLSPGRQTKAQCAHNAAQQRTPAAFSQAAVRAWEVLNQGNHNEKLPYDKEARAVYLNNVCFNLHLCVLIPAWVSLHCN